MSAKLFEPARVGDIAIRNRIAMAPMTRSRAIGGAANALIAEYYAQRAGAGLIVTEAIAPNADGKGYSRIPVLDTPERAESWKPVTAAVHARGASIVAQLMHSGRIGHPANMDEGARLLAPSDGAAKGDIWTDQSGPQPMPPAQAMTEADIREVKASFVTAARLAREAGFDGVELHGANGYLLEQFFNPHANRRTDRYGGSISNRIRLTVEVAQAVAEAIGPGRVGLRISPHSTLGDLPDYVEADALYLQLAEALAPLGLAFLHVIGDRALPELMRALRRTFRGAVIVNGGYDAESAEAELASGKADVVSFGRPFVANPDFVERVRTRAPLAEPDPATFFSPGPEGFVDYPALVEARAAE